MRPGILYYGTAPGRDLLSNQFDYDPPNQSVDSDVRVLQARSPSGRPFATLLNFSAHTTVLGSGNRKVSGDWVQAANPLLARSLRRRGDDRGRHPRPHPAGRPGLRHRPAAAGRDRAATCAASARTRSGWSSGPRTRPSPPSRSGGAAVGRGALVPGPGRRHQRPDPRPQRGGRPGGRAAEPRDHAAVADRHRGGHGDRQRADRRRAAVDDPGRGVPADRARGRGPREGARPHDGGPGQRPARLPDRARIRPTRSRSGAASSTSAATRSRRSTTTTTSSTSRTRWASG